MNLVVGATGLLGSQVCSRLRELGKPVKALVRATAAPDRIKQFDADGIRPVLGDLKDPASLERACKGVSTVISTASSTLSRQAGDSIETVDRQGQLALIDASRAAGVERFVFVSISRNIRTPSPLLSAKRDVERRLQNSGPAFTILQANYFMEVWLGPALSFDFANARARIYGSGNNPVSYIALNDVAAFTVESAIRQSA